MDDTGTNRPEDATNSPSTGSNTDETPEQSGSTGTTGTTNTAENNSQTQPRSQPQPNTRNITLSIQYSYAMPGRLGNVGQQQQQQQASGANTGSDDNNNNNSNNGSNTEQSETPTSNNTTPSTSNPNEPRLNPGPTPFQAPAGSFVLSFRDVPVSTPQARLESIIALATELAMRRFSELTSRPKGISVQAFQSLPVLSLSEVYEKYGSDFTCSICYEPFMEEDTKKESILDGVTAAGEGESSEEESGADTSRGGTRRRRRRGSSFGEDSNTESERLERIKRQRTEAMTVQQDSTDGTTTGDDAEEERFLHSPLLLPCGHVFGRKCMYKWTRLENTCPLCRHIIVENDQYQQQPQHNPAIDEGFERLRSLLYSADNIDNNDNPNNGDTPSLNTPSNDTTGTNTSMGDAGTAESNSGQPNDSNTAGATPNNFRFQTIPLGFPHIVFINPEIVRRQTTRTEDNPATTTDIHGNTDNAPSSSDASAATNETGQNPTAGSRNTVSSGATPQVTMTNAGRIHWFPLPLFFRSVNNNNNNGNSTNYASGSSNVSSSNTSTSSPTTTTTTAAATTERQPEVGAPTPSTESETTADNASNSPYNRLRTVIGHFFDTVTANHRPDGDNNNNNNDNNNHNNTASTNTDSNASGANPINFFPTGVVSFRNRNGEVSTFHLNGRGVTDRIGNTFTQRQTESRSQAPTSADGHNSTTVSEDNSADNDTNNGSRDSNDNNSRNTDSRSGEGNSPSGN